MMQLRAEWPGRGTRKWASGGENVVVQGRCYLVAAALSAIIGSLIDRLSLAGCFAL